MEQVAEKQEAIVEDLTVTEEKAGEVKAGAIVDYFLRVEGVDGESASSTESQRTLRRQ